MKLIMLIALFCSLGSVAIAESHTNTYLTNQTQTMFVRAEAGWTTYDSELIESNASAPTTTYTVGGYAGEHRVFGIFMSSTGYDVDFDLNDSTVSQAHNDIRMQARIGTFYPSVVYSQMRMKAKYGDETTRVDVSGNSAGVGMAFYYPLITSIVLHAEASALKTTNITTQTDNDVEIGLRQEGEIAASADLTDNLFDVTVGYRYKNFTITIDDQESKEVMSTPFAGIQVGTKF